jgi:hypothetical protein
VQKDKLITTEELLYAVENYATESNFKAVAEILLEAINDWPTGIAEPDELISELKNHINEKLTFDTIERFLKTLRVEKDAWKMESLSSILKVFNFERNVNIDREVELEVILERITKHYRK